MMSPYDLGTDLSDRLGAELVESIIADWVQVVRPDAPGLHAKTTMERIAANMSAPRESDPFYAIEDSTGIDLFRDELEKGLRSRWNHDQTWRDSVRELG